MVNNSAYFLVSLLCASWFTQHVTGAPLRTHVKRKTIIWVTDKNTLNSTQPLNGRSVEERQWGSPNGSPDYNAGGSPFGAPNPNTWVASPPAPSPSTPTTLPNTSPSPAPPPPPQTTTSVSPSPPGATPAVEITTAASPTPATSTSPSPPPPPPPPGTSVSPTSTVPAPPASTTLTTLTTSTSLTTTSTTSTTSAPPPPSTTTTTSPPPPPTTTTTSSPPPPPTTTSAPPPPPTTTSAPPPPATTTSTPSLSSGGNTLQLSLANNLGSNNVHAYITGLDSSGKVVMVTPDGTFYYPGNPGTTTPQPITGPVAIPLAAQGQTTKVTIPDYISSARVWFADGTLQFYVVDTQYGPGIVEPTTLNPDDPSADTNWGFVELTFDADDGLFANLSFVDFVGLPLGIQLQTSSSGTQSAPGMPPNAVTQVCNKLKGKASQDSQPWDKLCVNDNSGNLLRVVAPSTLVSQATNSFSGYWDSYVNQVWQQYTSQQLTIDTQTGAGNVSCTSDGTTITCDGDNRGYTKPAAEDIFGCNSGPFNIEQTDNAIHQAVVPRICAALNRATMDIAGGNVQPSLPPSSYYQSDVNNWYSAYVHQVEANGLGYAFSYDDVSPSTSENVSGSVSAADPTLLTVFIGGSSS